MENSDNKLQIALRELDALRAELDLALDNANTVAATRLLNDIRRLAVRIDQMRIEVKKD